MTLLDSIAPTKTARVMDLVKVAGIDVSDWANYAKGSSAAAANPRYCYEWAFVSSDVVVLNLWLDNMIEKAGRIVHRANYRREAEENKARGAKSNWQQRGFALDRALQTALMENLPIRVIVNKGDRRAATDPDQTSSSVRMRKLDELTWTIAAYDWSDGSCELVRSHHAAPVSNEWIPPLSAAVVA